MGEVADLRPRGGLSAPAPLGTAHDIATFDCGKPVLNDWLRVWGIKSAGRSARTYVVAEGATVVGYYSLAMGAASLADVPRKIRRNMPKQAPLAVIGRLAVDARFQGRGIGGALLRDAFDNCLAISGTIGCAGVTVHAIDDDAMAFYVRYGMVEFPSGTRTLFLPIETIRGFAEAIPL